MEKRTDSMDFLELKDLPVEVLTKILSYVPSLDLIVNCNHVCQDWWAAVMGQTLWRYKYEHSSVPLDPQVLATSDLMVLYFNQRFGQNLIKNPDAKQGLNDWVISKNGGNGFIVEESPSGCHPIQNFVPTEEVHAWVTSYGWCKKSQLVNLKDLGMQQETFDLISPDIKISEWYAPRFDCGCKYSLRVSLLSVNMTVIDEFHFEDRLPAGRDWHHIEHTFRGYRPRVQFIEYKHKGMDTQFWLGHYGAKMTLSSVTLDFSNIRQRICESERHPQGADYFSEEGSDCDNIVLSRAHSLSSSSLSSSSSIYSSYSSESAGES